MKGGRWSTKTGHVETLTTPEEFPLGERGIRPVIFTIQDDNLLSFLKREQIPGLLIRGKRVSCAWELAPIISRWAECAPLVEQLYAERLTAKIPLPGLDKYQELNLPKILFPHQKDVVMFGARRAYMINAEATRTGKCIESLAEVAILDLQHVLIIAPALAKLVWAEEITKWLKLDSVTVWGKGGDELRIFCTTCLGAGIVKTNGNKPCTACRARNGQALGETIVNIKTTVRGTDGVYRCPLKNHRAISTEGPMPCKLCKVELMDRLRNTRFTICNFDILSPHRDKTGAGVEFYREDLPGWASVFAQLRYDAVIIDECHRIKGVPLSGNGSEETHRAEKVYQICEPITRVKGLTATPMHAFTRDVFMQLSIVSKGLWS